MLKLHRVDYLQVASLKSNGIQLLSSKGDKNQQKMAVGDQRGILQLVSIRRGGEPFTDFKVDLNSPINCLSTLSDVNESASEVLVLAIAQTIRGFSLKGKPVFTLETNLVEPIQHLWIQHRQDIVAASAYVYNHYQGGKEANYFLSTDRINAVTVLPPNKVPSLTPLLACQDGTIYSLRESSIRHRLPLDSIPSALQLFRNDGGSSGECVVYGTFSGEIGLMRCSRAGPTVQWILQNPASKAAVTSLDFYDLKGITDGLLQLIVGRDDGFVEVYELDNGEDDVNPPNLIFSQNFHDSIAVVRGGVVGAVGYTEILVATQHGWIFGLTSSDSLVDRRKRSDQVTANRMSMQNVDRRNQLYHLKNEVELLEKKLADAQQQAINRNKKTSTSTTPPTLQQLNVIAKMNFMPEESVYYVSLESQVSINYCLVQSDADIRLIDVERNLALLSTIKSKIKGLLATFRCQANTSRLEMKLHCRERSTSDVIRFYISPGFLQSGIAALKTFRLVCLCQHLRCQPFDWADRPYSRLIFRGGFSLADAHNWIVACLPNVPDKVPMEEDVKFYFRNEQWSTLLSCHYRRGEVIFESDNVVGLSHVREFISREATVRNVQLGISAEVKWDNTCLLVERIHPQLMDMIHRRQQSILATALKEALTDQLAQDPNSSDWMTEEFRTILQTADRQEGAEDSSSSIEELQNFLVALYSISHGRFSGDLHASQRNALTEDVISSSTTESLLEMFEPKNEATTNL